MSETPKVQTNLVNKVVVICAALIAVMAAGKYLIIQPIADAISNSKVVVVDPDTPDRKPVWGEDLTKAFKAEQNPERVEEVRNVWAGLRDTAANLPKEVPSVYALQRLINLSGTIAITGLGEENPEAEKIFKEQFEKQVLAKVDDPLDAEEVKIIERFFAQLTQATADAL